jgi:hypothetical protein
LGNFKSSPRLFLGFPIAQLLNFPITQSST